MLGGGNNTWANVDFAAAFGACVTGHPILAHAVKNKESLIWREDQALTRNNYDFSDISYKLRGGLSSVITANGGTANRRLGGAALNLIAAWKRQGIMAYAKTGTLRSVEGQANTSRFVVVLIRWANEKRGIARKGITLSIVGEKAGTGTAASWLGEYLVSNQKIIEQYIN